MSTVHRRVLPAAEPRCNPSPGCPKQAICARYTSPLPQGIGAKMGNFSTPLTCTMYLSALVSDEQVAREEAAKRAAKPAAPFPGAKP